MIPNVRANLETIIFCEGEFSGTISCRIKKGSLSIYHPSLYLYILYIIYIYSYYSIVYSMTFTKQTFCWDFFVQFISKFTRQLHHSRFFLGIPGPLMKDRPVLVTKTSSLPSGGSKLPGNEDRKFAALFLKIHP